MGHRASISRLVAVLVFFIFAVPSLSEANDSAGAFMSTTFGLSAKRTQRRMENNGATASDFVRNNRLTMKGDFEGRSAIFIFGFHPKKGLNQKAAYIASSGAPDSDRALYNALRQAYNIRFGEAEELAAEDYRKKGKITLRSSWRPNAYTTILLSYNPQLTERFPGDSPGFRAIHLIYTYTKWK